MCLYDVYTMCSFVIGNLTNGYVKIFPQLNHLTMIGNGVTFTPIYKPKMIIRSY